MKNILFITVLLLVISCKAQTIVPLSTSPLDAPENAYYKDLNNDLNKYIGIWKYENGNTTFLINLVKKENVKSIDSFDDRIIGWYIYVENGNTIVNTTQIPDNYYFIYGSNLSDDGNRIILHFNDPARPKMSAQLSLEYISSGLGSNPKLEWKLFYTGLSHGIIGDPAPLTDFRVPTELTLTKQ